LLDDRGQEHSDPAEVNALVKGFYSALYARSPPERSFSRLLLPDGAPAIGEEQRARLDEPFSMGEILAAIGKLKRRKAPGEDGLPAEFFQTFAAELTPLVHRLTLLIRETGDVPASFRSARTRLLPKGGELRDLSNWRPITVVNTDAKLLAKLWSERLGQLADGFISPEQTYAVPGRSMDANLLLANTWFSFQRSLQEEALRSSLDSGTSAGRQRDGREGMGALAVAVDLRKAFDCVDQELLLELLERMGFPASLRAYLRSCWRHALINVFFRGRNVHGVPVRRGIRQGDSLSPLLFSTYFELVLRAFRVTLGRLPRVCPSTPAVSAYADDLLLLLPMSTPASAIENFFELLRRGTGLEVNREKSSVMAIGSSWARQQDWVRLGIPTARYVRYLGVPLGDYSPAEAWSRCLQKVALAVGSFQGGRFYLPERAAVWNAFAAPLLRPLLFVCPPPTCVTKRTKDLLRIALWGKGRPRVLLKDLCAPRRDGGLGLLTLERLETQMKLRTFALVAKFWSTHWCEPARQLVQRVTGRPGLCTLLARRRNALCRCGMEVRRAAQLIRKNDWISCRPANGSAWLQETVRVWAMHMEAREETRQRLLRSCMLSNRLLREIAVQPTVGT